jgi:ParB-like chromosome segregation protein Spo0J
MTDAARPIEVVPTELGEALCAVRLCPPEAQQEMKQSLAKLGQLSPVQVYRESGKLEVIDGFKRLHAARALSWPKLRAELQPVDAAGAKVQLWRCNAGTGLCELEEAWLVRALYRDDKLTQPQIGQLLARHKSWVCRRLMLAEGLTDEVTADVRLGLLSR